MNSKIPINTIRTPPIFISRFEYLRIRFTPPRKKAKRKNGKANPMLYAVINVNQVPGSLADSAIIAVKIGPIQGDQPAEKPIPKIKEPT
ncbi:hypothetical protein D3C76_1720440 [compost metagenome]